MGRNPLKRPLRIGVESDAIFGGPHEMYRYTLTRIWNAKLPCVNFLMLNPSTADHRFDDPTVAKCQVYARLWGYGGIVVTNIFAVRSTCPRRMKLQPEPIGRLNDVYIEREARKAGLVVCAWGHHGDHLGRGVTVLGRLRELGVIPHALKVNQDGMPAHPLYLNGALTPFVLVTPGA